MRARPFTGRAIRRGYWTWAFLAAFLGGVAGCTRPPEAPADSGSANAEAPAFKAVRPERRTSLGMRWLVQYARQRSGRTMRDKLAAEILDASNNAGAAVKRREDTHKMAEANKAFAHYRW